MTTEPPKKCFGNFYFCEGVTVLINGCSNFFVARHMEMKTGLDTRFLLAVKRTGKNSDIFLNFCPVCGASYEERLKS